MLMHHDAREYETAAKEAADWALPKFKRVIEEGKANLTETITKIAESHPQDAIVGARAFKFGSDEKGFGVKIPKIGHPISLHRHAIVQAADRIGMPAMRSTIDWMNSIPEGPQNLAKLFNDHFHHQEKTKYLIRMVDGQIRGFLSDRYRRLNSGPIVEALMTAAASHGAMPVKAKCLDTKFDLKFIHPVLHEPIPNEYMLFGLKFRTSDFGNGGLLIGGFVHRLRCTNLMITEDSFSQVHLGGRLSESLKFSEKTYQLDTETVASAIEDVVRNVFAPEYVTKKMKIIKALAETNVDADSIIDGLTKKGKLTLGDSKEVKALYSSADVEMLPPGQNMHRLTQALALFGGQQEVDKQEDFEQLSGEVAGLRVKQASSEANEVQM